MAFIFGLAVFIFVVAGALIVAEHAATRYGLDDWYVIGMRLVGMVLFILDAILIVGVGLILTVKLLSYAAKEKL